MPARIHKNIRSNLVAYLALFFALTGVAYAAGPLKAGDPAGGDLTGTYPNPQIAADAVGSSEVADASLTGADIQNDSLTGQQVDESALGKVPRSERADSTANADLLDSLDSTAFTRPACNSQTGAVKGFARIDANSSFPSEFTTSGVQFPYNCSGGTVEARRRSQGGYEVRFNGADPQIAVGTATVGLAFVQVGKRAAPGVFSVGVFGPFTSGSNLVDEPFVIAAL